MILTVALNPAVDLTYRLPVVRWSGTNRVQQVDRRAGGKAINVARVLRALGQPAVVTGFAGGHTGEELREGLTTAGVGDALVRIGGETRRTVTVVDTRGSTVLNEPGPAITDVEWRSLVGRVSELCDEAEAVVLSGSLPPGVPQDAYAVLARHVGAAGIPAILDADGTALARGVGGRPTIVKPNTDELERATGEPALLSGAEALRQAGAESVVVSLGAGGLVACTPEGRWRAAPPQRLPGNPTGAGDAAVASLAASLVSGQPWPRRLAHATAASAAAVLLPTAGDLDQRAYRDFLEQVEVLPWDTAPAGAPAGSTSVGRSAKPAPAGASAKERSWPS